MKTGATIRDVAAAARVSPSAVSRHLNKTLALPPATAARIESACTALGYRPNHLAKRLSLGQSEMIGLATPEISNPFFAALAAAAEAEAQEAGYSLLITSTSEDLAREIANIDRLASGQVDGMLVLTNRPDDGQLKRLIDGRTDVVLLDEDVPGARVARIFVENEEGAAAATTALIAAGHRRIAHVGGPKDLFSARERFAGFTAALARAGLPCDGRLVRFGTYDRASGLASIRALLAEMPAPTAVFTGSDYIAIGVLAGLREAGLSVPADVSIASFDDMPFADLLDPPLTTVRQPINDLGRQGIRTLLQQIRSGEITGTRRLPTVLVERHSVMPPKRAGRSSTRARAPHIERKR